MLGIAKGLSGYVDRLESEPHYASHAAAERHDPSVAIGGFPVGGQDGGRRYIPALSHVVVDKVLQQHLVYFRALVVGGDGPYVVDQRPDCPWAGLDESDNRWTQAEL